MVLIDTPRTGDKGSHMVASSIQELHTFAESIDIKRCYYENKRGKHQPHYDVKGDKVFRAIDAGAKLVERRELFNFLK